MTEMKFNNYGKFISDVQDGTIKIEVSGVPAHFNDFGVGLLATMCLDLRFLPVEVSGEAGWGKSVIAKAAASVVGLATHQTNGTRSTTQADILGELYPVTKLMPDGSYHNALDWHRQAAYIALTEGGVFLFDEYNVVDAEIQTMMHSWLEVGHATYSIPQLGLHSQSVNEKFWPIFTGNPPGKGYAASRVGTALKDRLYTLTQEPIDQPLADESKMLKDILVTEKDDRSEFIDPLMNWVNELRHDKTNTNVNTRDLAKSAVLIDRGKPPVDSIAMACSPDVYPDGYGVIIDNARLHFGKDKKVIPSVEIYDGIEISKPTTTYELRVSIAKITWDK